ncbi:hypothetical protein DENSPDRAFT_880719 [Dentipellis sp. KUC8613]|nr:hypothetical protein DENSPDRAFT_880719 [Dentipellis sp. KUC8613]
MVKLSIPKWDKEKDKDNHTAGTSFTPDLSDTRPSRPRTAPPTPSTSFSPLFRLNSDLNNRPDLSSLITLKLSSPSFIDSVVHDDLSDNPLYVIETVDNITKIRRSDAKGFITVARVRWTPNARSSSRRSKEVEGPHVSLGSGSWKHADEFLTYSYGTLTMSRKFYIPHHASSMRWKRVGTSFHCNTSSVKGPVAILEPTSDNGFPQLKIYNALSPQDDSRKQKLHGGVPISLLDFLLVTSLLLVTDANEWTNVTRVGPIDEPDESVINGAGPSHISRASHGSSVSLSSRALHPSVPPPVPAMPAVEMWRQAVPSVRSDSPDGLRPGSPSSPAHTSAASQSSESTDPISTPASPGANNPFSFPSPSRTRFSSVPSLAPSRELPIPPVPPPIRLDHPWASTPSPILYDLAGQASSAHTSTASPYPYSASIRSPTVMSQAASSSSHLSPRSLPPIPLDSFKPSTPRSDTSPGREGLPPRSRLSHKPPPNYLASAHDSNVPIPLDAVSSYVRNPDESFASSMNGLSISTGLEPAVEPASDPGYECPPPAYTAADAARSPLQALGAHPPS